MGHQTTDCQKDPSTPAECVHCEENHTSSYKGCKFYQNLLHSRTTKSIITTMETSAYNRNVYFTQNETNGAQTTFKRK